MEAADCIRMAVMRKVKNCQDLSESVPCRRDILYHWFEGKGEMDREPGNRRTSLRSTFLMDGTS